jgi:DNA repair protein RadC
MAREKDLQAGTFQAPGAVEQVAPAVPNEIYQINIKALPEDLRPRERLAASGPEELANFELLAIILRTGWRQENALALAQRLLAKPYGLRFLAEVSFTELAAIKGLGPAKAAQIKAAVELGRRLAQMGQARRPAIHSPADVARLLMEDMRYLDREHFRSLALNTRNQVLAVNRISVGSLNSSIVHPREVFKQAISSSAAAVILVHNHPSGDPAPSSEDIEVTGRLVQAGNILGITVLDHIIIGDGRYLSFKEKGLMEDSRYK